MATPGPCGSYTGESDHPLPTKEKSKVTLFEKRRRACKHDRPTSQVLDIDLRTKATCLRNKGKQKGTAKRVDPKDAGFNNKRSVQFDGSRNFDFSARLMELEAEKQQRESKMSEMESQIKKLVEHVFKQPVRATGTHLMQNSNQFPPPYPPQSLFQPQVWYNAPDPNPDPVAVPIPPLTRISAATPNPIPILIPSSNSAFCPAPINQSQYQTQLLLHHQLNQSQYQTRLLYHHQLIQSQYRFRHQPQLLFHFHHQLQPQPQFETQGQ